MADKRQMDPALLTDKENIRKNIRNSLAYKSAPPVLSSDLVGEPFEPIPNLFKTFVETFRAAGGKYIPCNPKNMVQYLVKIAQGQDYHTLLNTSPNLGAYLDKYKVRHVNAINLNEPVDAALFFTDVLVARNGAIGFTQSVAQYASVRNLAKDIIVVSRGRCIFQDVEQALDYMQQRNGNKPIPMVEFVAPTKPEEINGKQIYTPRSPRIILMLMEEPQAPQEQVQTSAQSQTQTQEPIQTPVQSQETTAPQPAQTTLDFSQNNISDDTQN